MLPFFLKWTKTLIEANPFKIGTNSLELCSYNSVQLEKKKKENPSLTLMVKVK